MIKNERAGHPSTIEEQGLEANNPLEDVQHLD